MADQTTKKRGRPRKIAVDEDEKILTDNASETLMMEQKSAAGTNGKVTINQVAESLFSLYGSVLGTYNGKWGGKQHKPLQPVFAELAIEDDKRVPSNGDARRNRASVERPRVSRRRA